MKKIIIVIILLILSYENVYALEYSIVNKEVINYEINNFYIDDENIIINGWAIIDGDIQHFIDDSTHSYSLYIENIYDSADNFIYSGEILSADKTQMYKYTTTTNVCDLKSTYNDAYSCFTRYENVGFEFSIPVKDLTTDAEYQIFLRIDGKTAGVYYQIALYTPNINDSYIQNGIEYSINSDLSTVDLTVITNNLFVRSGPDTSLNEVYGNYSSCSYGSRLYWGEYITFSTLQEVYQTSDDYDADTWFRLLYNEGLCQNNRSRAIMGYSYSGWIASVHTDFSGTPATIKTTLLDSINMGDIITYTAKSGSKGTLSLNVESEIKQNINIQVFYLGNLVNDENYDINGSKTLDFSFELETSGDIYIVITEENGTLHTYETEIYISSEEKFIVNESSKIISPSTPIVVVKNGELVNYLYEEIEAMIPYNYINLSSGSSFYAWVLVNYSTNSNKIYLNNDIVAYEVFSSAEETLLLDKFGEDNFIINLEKTDYNNYQAVFNLPIMYLSNPEGFVYLNYDDLTDYVNGGRKWYTPINDEFGVYDYNIYLENIGINSIDITFDCSYELTKTIFGNNLSEYVIVRVENPLSLDYFLYKTYDNVDLTYYKERLNL